MPTFGRTSQASHAGKSAMIADGLDVVVSSFMFEAVTIAPKAGVVAVRSADRAAQRMRNRVPIGTPQKHVLDSITSDQTPSITAHGAYADAGPDPTASDVAFVARFLEHGTIHMAPQPFVGPSGDETLPEFIDDMRKLPSL